MTIFMHGSIPGIIALGVLVGFGVKNFFLELFGSEKIYKEFACSNCGHRFGRTFINTLCSEIDTIRHPKSNYLKCPKCKVRDECSSLDGR